MAIKDMTLAIAASAADIFFCRSSIRLSRIMTVEGIIALICLFRVGASKFSQFMGGGCFFEISSAVFPGRPLAKIDFHMEARSGMISGARTRSS